MEPLLQEAVEYFNNPNEILVPIAHTVNNTLGLDLTKRTRSGVNYGETPAKKKQKTSLPSSATTFQSSPNVASDMHRSINTHQTARKTPGTGDDEEVQVVPPPKRLALAAPDYFSIDLKWCKQSKALIVKNGLPQSVNLLRLNSIFDPDTGGTNHQPMGRDFWATLYKYYRVLATHVEWTAVNQEVNATYGSSSVNNLAFMGFQWTDDASEIPSTTRAFIEMKQAKVKMLCGPDEAPYNVGSVTYEYTPGSWDYHIQETGDEERWTPIGSNPPNQHYLRSVIAPFLSGDTGTTNVCNNWVVKFTVQFREANVQTIGTADTS